MSLKEIQIVQAEKTKREKLVNARVDKIGFYICLGFAILAVIIFIWKVVI